MNNDQNSVGIRAIYESCFKLYPDQPTPPQVTALQKFWLGGPDPLDYISMYKNNGYTSLDNDKASSYTHWHYVTYGLSDLYGDSRLHDPKINADGPSGFGFELTFRLRKFDEDKAPLWPAMILQSLSRYLFRSQSKFVSGDHIPWGKPLEDITTGSSEKGFENCNSIISNMLIATDPQLEKVSTPHGWIEFLQIVGVCDEEIALARKGSGIDVLLAMQKYETTGGRLLVTDTRRGESLINLDSSVLECIESGKRVGSTMSGVTTEIYWCCIPLNNNNNNSTENVIHPSDNESIIDIEGDSEADSAEKPSHFVDSHNSPFYGIPISPKSLELFPAPQYIDSVHLRMGKAAAEIMSCIIADRLRYGRHFTFLHPCCRSNTAITLIPQNVIGAFVSLEKPFGFRGSWLQIFITEESLDELEIKFSKLTKIDSDQLPIQLSFFRQRLTILVLHTRDIEPTICAPSYNNLIH